MNEEMHDIFDQRLYAKEEVNGKNVLGQEVSCFKFKIKCALCYCEYVRFCYNKSEFDAAVIGDKMVGQGVTPDYQDIV